MKHLDLFSGIGGFALASERVWPSVQHLFCEIDPFCNEVLKKHWPKAPIVSDIRQLTSNPVLREHNTEQKKIYAKNKISQVGGQTLDARKFVGADLLTGGFPCQPFSQAGQRRGTADDRHLWPEMLRVIREFHPRWVIGENVGGLVTWSGGLVLEQVHTDLESEGYEVQAFIIPACALNAPHRRDRVWIVANRISDGTGSAHGSKIGASERGRKKQDKCEGSEVRSNLADGGTQRGDVADTTNRRRKKYGTQPKSSDDFGERSLWNKNWLEVATRLCRVDDGLPKRLDRNPRLKALGNAIVPQVAEEIMRAIQTVDNAGITG